MKGRTDNTDGRKRQGRQKRPSTNMDRHRPDKKVHTAPAMWTCNMKGRKENTDDRKNNFTYTVPKIGLDINGQICSILAILIINLLRIITTH